MYVQGAEAPNVALTSVEQSPKRQSLRSISSVGIIDARELQNVLSKPAVDPQEGGTQMWSNPPPFSDPEMEREFVLASSRDFLSRMVPITGIFFASVLAVLILTYGFPGVSFKLTNSNPFYTAFVFFLLFLFSCIVSSRRFPYIVSTRVLIETMFIVLFPLAIILANDNRSLSIVTFLIIVYIYITTVVFHPSWRIVTINSLLSMLIFVIAAAGLIPTVAHASAQNIIINAMRLSIILVLSNFLWLAAASSDRLSFVKASQLDGTWRATERVIVAALPRQIIPTLMEHVVFKVKQSSKTYASVKPFNVGPSLGVDIARGDVTCNWSNAPAVVEPDVTIMIVRFPELSHAVFPDSAAAAIAQLRTLLTLCGKTATAHGVTTLEFTNTEFVGVVGLAGEGAAAGNAAAAIRAGLAIIATLPPAFVNIVVIGVHSGPAVSGFVGTLRPRFTLSGDTMTMAAFMASSALPGAVTVSNPTYVRITGLFILATRTINVKENSQIVIADITSERAPLAPEDIALSFNATGAGTPESSSSFHALYMPQTFTSMYGFSDKDTEARYLAQPMPTRSVQLIAAIILVSLSFSIINHGDASNSNFPADVRMYSNAVAIFFALVLAITTFSAPNSEVVRIATRLGYAICLIILPLFARDLWSIILTCVLLIFVPLSNIKSPLHRSILYFLHVLIITFLEVSEAYEQQVSLKGDTAGLFWLWMTFLCAMVVTINADRMNRTRFARHEALIAAQEAGAIVLRHLFPRTLLDRLVSGVELADHTKENDDVAVLVADIADFVALRNTESSPTVVFDLVNCAFAEFERVAHANGAFKVKTMGYRIIFTAGLRDFPGPAGDRAARVALLVRVARGIHTAAAHLVLRVRIGIHAGPLVSGLMNSRGFVYDVWGEGILQATAAMAAAPNGGTAFTQEAAAVLDAALSPSDKSGKGNKRSSSMSFISTTASSSGFPSRAASATNGSIGTPTTPSRSISRGSSLLISPRFETIPSGGSACEPTLTPGSHDFLIIMETVRKRSAPKYRAPNSPESLSPPVGNMLSWSWNIFCNNYEECRLPVVAFELLKPSLARGLFLDGVVMAVTERLCASYKQLPFHNAFHGVATMQAFIMLAHSVPAVRAALSDFDVCLLAFASLGHAAGHPGYSSAHAVAVRSEIALAHGCDGPVHERFAAATTIAILEECGAFALLEPNGHSDAAQTVATAIMACDILRHDAILNDLNRCGTLYTLSFEALNGALVHCADFSTHVFTRANSIEWAQRINAEFTSQVAAECLHGLPVTRFMTNLDKPLASASYYTQLIRRTVAPLWRALALVSDGTLDEPIANLEDNMRYYASETMRLSSATKGIGCHFFSCLTAFGEVEPDAATAMVKPPSMSSFPHKTTTVLTTTISRISSESPTTLTETMNTGVDYSVDEEINPAVMEADIEITISSMKRRSHEFDKPPIET